MFKLKIIVDNVIKDRRFKYAWGYSVYVNSIDGGILFDTGPDGDILLNNLKLAGVYTDEIRHIFISHIHLDHIGGLKGLLRSTRITPFVYIPESLSKEFEQKVVKYGVNVVRLREFKEIVPNIYSTGQLGVIIAEQSLVLDTHKGLVLITGCSHPGLNRIVSHVINKIPEKRFHLIIGGFHLIKKDENYIVSLFNFLDDLGVNYIAPTHCSGTKALEIARYIFGQHRVIQTGAGDIINI